MGQLNRINFIYGQGGLGYPIPGQDFITGLVGFCVGSVTSLATNTAKLYTSWQQAVTDGFTTANADIDISLMSYAIQTFFEANTKGQLWVMYKTVTSATPDMTLIPALQNASGGKIRQIGIVTSKSFSKTFTDAIQAQVTACVAANKPLEAYFAADIHSVVDLTTLPDLTTFTDQNVHIIIGMDGSGLGHSLFVANNISYGALGTALGFTSYAAVNENIGWERKFDATQNSIGEFETICIANGQTVASMTDAAVAALDALNYIFLVNEVGYTGSYFNDSYGAIPRTSDYAYAENNRAIQKATRQIRFNLAPDQNAPVYANADGTLAQDSLGFFKNEAAKGVLQMVTDGELSNAAIVIDPTQNVITSGKITITAQLQPVGVARAISIPIGFVVAVQQNN